MIMERKKVTPKSEIEQSYAKEAGSLIRSLIAHLSQSEEFTAGLDPDFFENTGGNEIQIHKYEHGGNKIAITYCNNVKNPNLLGRLGVKVETKFESALDYKKTTLFLLNTEDGNEIKWDEEDVFGNTIAHEINSQQALYKAWEVVSTLKK